MVGGAATKEDKLAVVHAHNLNAIWEIDGRLLRIWRKLDDLSPASTSSENG